MEILEITEVDDGLVTAWQTLMPQLSSSKPPPSKDYLQKIASSEASTLLVAREDDMIYGCMTLVMFDIPTGLRAWIEDVVVDEASRGKGVGAMLNKAALEIAREAGATTVDLTSRPSRETANRLYKRLGFELRETNVYRLDF